MTHLPQIVVLTLFCGFIARNEHHAPYEFMRLGDRDRLSGSFKVFPTDFGKQRYGN
jgi:hypothetical protein